MATAEVTDRDILPDQVKPSHYALSIYDLELGGAFSYQGKVDISLKIHAPTTAIVLNSHHLVLHSAELVLEHTKTQQKLQAADISYDEPKQRVTITFPEELPATNAAVLSIKYQGTMNSDMAGFYRSQYKSAAPASAGTATDGEWHYMFSTQFESCDARRALPCFDEPNLKASFDFEIEIPKDQVALSNMPEQATREGNNGRHFVSFERTPVMSTYLLAWAVGDFEHIEAFTERKYNGKHLPVRVYTTKGLKDQAQYALDHAYKIVDIFSELFGIDYPLPKADLLAVHDFAMGAMENWGLVTYRTTAVLFDEKTSAARAKRYVGYVVAHELAHQWFGNLVTMDWWSELWLNEGFATWVGWVATDQLHPEWDVWPYFIADSMRMGFKLDALRSSHPIEVPVRDALDVDQIFDAISYRKGSSVIRMLAAHLGMDVFLKGVSNYLKAHAYQNATTTDLWSALSEASGQDIPSLMDPWIRQIGFPVVTIKENGDSITFKQSRYLSTGDVTADDDTTTWWVPLGIKGKVDTEGAATVALTAKEDTIQGISEDFYKINVDSTGFYHTSYPPERLAKLSTQISKLSTEDKIGIIADAEALAMSGEGTTASLLAFVEGFSQETNYVVWSQVIDSLSVIRGILSEETPVKAGLDAFMLKLVSAKIAEMGWEFKPDEDFLTGQLRVLLIDAASRCGDEAIIAEAKKRFAAFIGGDEEAAVPTIRSVIFQTAVRNGSATEYQAVKKEWDTTTTIDGKEIALSALGRTRVPELQSEYLKLVFTDVRLQDMHTGALAMAAAPESRRTLWTYLKANFDQLTARLGGNTVVMERFLRVSLGKFTDHATEQDIAAFFAGKDNRGYDRGLAQISDAIKSRADFRLREKDAVLKWLSEHGYTS